MRANALAVAREAATIPKRREAPMNDRAAIEAMLRDAYAARVRGDVEATVGHFAEDAVFALAGAKEASPVAMRCTDCESLRTAMAGLIGAFEFRNHEIVSLIIDGPTAAVHTRVRVRAAGTGEEVTTEMVDLITVRDGKIVSFLEFCDTAMAAKLMAA
jgi:ketosteroid isomerase-like protein